MAKRGAILFSTAAAVACVGGAQLVLEGPIADQCAAAGLKGCPDIAAGAVQYADGKQAEGERSLSRGLSMNLDKATELKDFAQALGTIGELPGAGQYIAPLQPAITLIESAAADAEKAAKDQASHSEPESSPNVSTAASGSASPPSETQQPPESGRAATKPPVHSRFVIIAGHEHAGYCRFSGIGGMTCVRQPVHSMVVTDVVVSTACTHAVVVAAAALGSPPSWLLMAPPSGGLSVHGADLPIKGHQVLTYAIDRAAGDDGPDVRCGVSIVWREDAPTEPKPVKTPVATGTASQPQDASR